jgi:hypothetical protein
MMVVTRDAWCVSRRAANEAQCAEIMQHGNNNRSTAFTEMNASSSRQGIILAFPATAVSR